MTWKEIYTNVIEQKIRGGLSVEVERETEDRLERFWVSVLRADLVKITKPRSVILCTGVNHISLTWRPKQLGSGIAAWAALFRNPGDDQPHGTSEIPKYNYRDIREFDTVTLNWEVTMRGPSS